MTKFCLLILILSAVFLLPEATKVYSGTGLPDGFPEDKPVILLGGLFPVHINEENECGKILDLGVQRLEAMVFATQLINHSPDLLPGATLGFEIRDTCVQGNLALEESLSYVRNRDNGENNSTMFGISGVVGAASSGISIVVANLLRLFQVPQISYASTAKILSDKTRFDYFFRTVPPDSLQARTMADIIFNFNWTYIHAIYSDDAYGSEGIDAFFDEIDRFNLRRNNNRSEVCIASVISIPLEVPRGDVFDDAVAELDREWVGNSSVVVLFGQLSTALGVLTAVKKVDDESPGFADQFTWIGSDAWGDQLPAEFHTVAQGMLSVSPKGTQSAAFDEYFTSLNPDNYTTNPWFNEYWEFVFNCSFTQPGFQPCDATKQAISPESGYRQNSKVTFTLDAVFAFAHAINNLITAMCPDDEPCDAILDMRSGGEAIKGELLLESLRNVSFVGMSAGTIEFDSSGDEQGDFVIRNLKQNPDEEGYFYDTIGTWSPIKFLNLFGDVEWNGGREDVPISICSLPCSGGEFPEPIPGQSDCCWLCQPCLGDRLVSTGLICSECPISTKPNAARTECVDIIPTFLQWRSAWSVVIVILALVGFLTTAMVASILMICYKHPLVKASSRELSFMMLIGLGICYIMPFFFLAKPSVGICTLRRFGVGIGFATCYGALLVKTNRVHRIFKRAQNSLQKPALISPQSQIFFTLLLVACQVVIGVVWLTVEHPTVEVHFTDTTGELICGESPIVGFFVYAAYNFILLCLSTFYGLRSRKIPQSFNESKFINFTVFSSVLLWIGLVPTYFATALIASVYQTLSLVLAVMLSATVMLCILFLSKVYYLLSKKRKEMREIRNAAAAAGAQTGGGRGLTLNSANLNTVRKFSMDLLSVKSQRNPTSILGGGVSLNNSLSGGSIHSCSINATSLLTPRVEGDKRSVTGSVGSNSAASPPKKPIQADAFTQTSEDESRPAAENRIVMGMTVEPTPLTTLFLQTTNDDQICEDMRLEIIRINAMKEQAQIQERQSLAREESRDAAAEDQASNTDAEPDTASNKSSANEVSVAIEGLDTHDPDETTTADLNANQESSDPIAEADKEEAEVESEEVRGINEGTTGPNEEIQHVNDKTQGMNEELRSAYDETQGETTGVFNAVNVCAIIVTDEAGVESPVDGWIAKEGAVALCED